MIQLRHGSLLQHFTVKRLHPRGIWEWLVAVLGLIVGVGRGGWFSFLNADARPGASMAVAAIVDPPVPGVDDMGLARPGRST
jgi:hypothetical protein